MLVRWGLAVTGAVAAVTYGRQLRNRDARLAATDSEHGEKRNESPDAVAQQKTPEEEEVKRVNPSSSAASSGGRGGGNEYGDSNLLLPEFDDLLHSVEVGGLSPRSVRSGKDAYDHGSEGEEGKDDTVRARISAKSRRVGRRSPSPGRKQQGGGSVDGDDQKSETSDLFPDGPDYLLGEYVDGLAGETAELHALRETVKVLKQKELRMEAELLDYYDLEDQELELQRLEAEMDEKTSEITKLEGSLEERNLEIGKLQSQMAKLRERIVALETRATKLADEAATVGGLRLDLEEARARNRELQKQINTRTGNDKAELLMLKQKVASFESEKEDGSKRDLETERKLQALREMEVEIVELRRTNKDLQFQKRELSVKLDAAEEDIDYLQSRTEEDILAEAEEDISSLRHANEDLARQVEGLQNDRFTEVEELVYLRWVNACLRYELRNFQAPDGQFSAMDLNKDLSPRSQEKAKHLMLQYAGPDIGTTAPRSKTESGYESSSSESSIPSEDYSDPFSEETGSTSGRLSKKNSLIKRLKSWTGRKQDDGGPSPSESSRSDPDVTTRSRKKSSKGPLEALMIRNTSDAVQITTYGAGNENEASQSPRTPSHTRSLSNLSSPGARSGSFRSNPNSPRSGSTLAPIKTADSTGDHRFNNIAASFQVIAKSVQPEISAKYPAFKDRHKAAVEREQAIKEKAQTERAKLQAEKERDATPKSNWTEQIIQDDESEPNRRAEVVPKPITTAEIRKRELRKPNPPPKPSSRSQPTTTHHHTEARGGPPPPPPPPPPRGGPPPPPPPPLGGLSSKTLNRNSDRDVHRAPEVVEFYQSLMKRDAKSTLAGASSGINPEARNNMIGEIENRSSHLLAIKADVETQGEFVMSLAAEVRAASYHDIKDVVDFVAWLDDELSFLVDERAVLKHFDWPEGKADAMREAAFEYKDLTKLLAEVSQFQDRPEIPCDKALKKMLAMLEKVEQSVYGLLRTRDMALARYKEFNIPVQWMLESGIVGKIKLASVNLARLYMTRVSTELKQVGPINEPVCEFLLLQGVRFAFRVHQFAGGFDPESMRAFEALRNFSHRSASPAAARFVEGNEEEEEEEEEQ